MCVGGGVCACECVDVCNVKMIGEKKKKDFNDRLRAVT